MSPLHFAIGSQPSGPAASPPDCLSCSLAKRIRKFDGYLEDKMIRLYECICARTEDNKKTTKRQQQQQQQQKDNNNNNNSNTFIRLVHTYTAIDREKITILFVLSKTWS